ncbi:DUF4097 family beta strand repeat-containing protein [Streptomyces sp. NPDC048306]|uniref:DUF4097 family beta strand repeat-containing protein n=1 Tax=Streptomyces sp. NPDC048306 TaxID=3154502 RepID=UPI0033D4991F
MTTQTFTATTAGPIWADVISHIGTVNVTVDRTLKNALITVSTPDEEGPVADAVRDTTSREHTSNGVNVLEVRVPKVNGGGNTFIGGGGFSTTTMTVGGSTFTFSGSGGVSMVGGDIYMGGKKIVENGRVIAEQGTVVGGAGGSGTVTVDVRLPELSSVRLDTTSADLDVRRGDLQVLDVQSVSGDVRAKGVHTLRGNLTSGDLEVERVEAKVDISSVSGDLEIGAYNGSDLRANSVSGDIDVSATPAATGFFTASTVSGDIEARGAQHLNPRLSTVSGRVRPRR